MFCSFLDFVQLHNGPVPDHPFEEAINGVFRQAKRDMRKNQQEIITKPVEKKKSNNGQQSIDKFCSKKSAFNIGHKIMQVSSNPKSNLDDDDDDDGEDCF